MKLISCFFLLSLPIAVFSQTSEKSLNELNWSFRQKGTEQWYAASVPGTVHTDLLNNKLIPDPFIGDNEKQLQWIENEDWEYKTTFTVSQKEQEQKHIELQFDGLDTYANVYLNDSLIITADNMFRCWNAEINSKIHLGDNQLKIVFQSAVNKGKAEAAKLSYTLPGDEKVFTRKAQYQYGWDFAPRFVTCGIWKNVNLVFWNEAKILNVRYVQQSLTDSLAELEFRCEIKSDYGGEFSLNAICNSTVEAKQKIHLNKGENKVTLNCFIKNPKRWWTNGLGEPTLYPFTISLSKENASIDKKELNIGLRTIELVQENDSIGKSFYFKLNGVPVFMKGANYIPPDNFLPLVTKQDYENIVQNAVEANMNMLRVWGGGVYADDAFYDACDKKGILVWQDFMFACAMYPGDEHFITNVKQEVMQQVIRLRNHPALALWCGNNEIDEGWKNWGWQKQYKYSKADSLKIWNDYITLFQKIIPDIVNEYSPLPFGEMMKERSFIPSSPSIGWGHKESLQQGDSHYWGVWWGMEPFEIYKNKVGRFMTEYGFQGMPSQSLIDKMGGNDSTLLKAHQKHPTGYQTIKTYMERNYYVPNDFGRFTYVSQLLQAEGMKTAIEAHRRAKPNCMGTLYWQLNDCWSGISWSSIDYYGNRKALYYQAKCSFENVLISINKEKDDYKIYIVNDELKNKKASLDLKVIDFKGKALWHKTIDITLISSSSKVYYSIPAKEFAAFNPKQIVLTSILAIMDNKKTCNANYYFVKPKELELTKPTINIRKLGGNKLEVISDVFATSVFIDFVLSDNYFDLLPGEKKIVSLTSESTNEMGQLKPNVISLYDCNKQ